MYKRIINNFPNVECVKHVHVDGPWKSKSGGILSSLLTLDLSSLLFFLNGRGNFEKKDRGLHIYRVNYIPNNGKGGKEFHKEREEIVFCSQGVIAWDFEDLFGKKRHIGGISETEGLWIPPYILHTYKALEDHSELIVVSNTIFGSGEDVYDKEEFEKMKVIY
jgi:hypothetical protein